MPTKTKLTKPNKKTKALQGATEVLRLLELHYPDLKCTLDFSSPFQLLVATRLSAQCTDERVNRVTPALFRAYPDSFQMAKAPLEHLEELVHSTGFYKTKAQDLRRTSEILVDQYEGRVPQNLKDLVDLPGVGRKSALVILSVAFGLSEGIVVDTHVQRLAYRMGFASATGNAQRTERELQGVVPSSRWMDFSHQLIEHGRRVCKARTPSCSQSLCFLFDLCPKRGVK